MRQSVWCGVVWGGVGWGCVQVGAWGFVVGGGFAEVPSNAAVFVVGRTPAQVREGGEDVQQLCIRVWVVGGCVGVWAWV